MLTHAKISISLDVQGNLLDRNLVASSGGLQFLGMRAKRFFSEPRRVCRVVPLVCWSSLTRTWRGNLLIQMQQKIAFAVFSFVIVQEPISGVPVVSRAYSRFAADVIHLCKLRVRHVGAHLRCEISCKFIAISIVPSFKYIVLQIFLVKKFRITREYFPQDTCAFELRRGPGKPRSRRYFKKVYVVGVDPVAIPSEQFNSECLPPKEVLDPLSYLVLETSY